MAWLAVAMDVTQEAVDWVRTSVAGTAYTGPMHLVVWEAEGEDSAAAAPWAYTLRLYVPDDGTGQRLLAAIAAQLHPLQRTRLISELAITDCAELPPPPDAPPTSRVIGDRLVLLPPGAPESADANQLTIQLDHSLAFGSGFHPATRLSLQLLDRHVQPGMQTLDLGCGSGILSVALAKLGATVLALDNDPIAVAATQAMATQNDVADSITAQVGSLGQGSTLGHWLGEELTAIATIPATATFDLIVANILARVHITLAADYGAALRLVTPPMPQLITAGFTTDYEADVVAALGAAGFVVADRVMDGEWVALACQRKI